MVRVTFNYPRIMFSFLAALCVIAMDAPAAEDNDAVDIKVELLTPRVFVGESPLLRVTFTAQRDTRILRPDLVYPGSTMALALFDLNGKNVSACGPPPDLFTRPIPAGDELALPAGSSVVVQVWAIAAPPSAGTYRLRVELSAHPHGARSVTRQFAVEAAPIDEDAIVQRIPLRQGDKTREVLTVKEGKAFTLFQLDPIWGLLRLGSVEAGGKIAARLDATHPKARIIIEIHEGSVIRLLVADFDTGELRYPGPAAIGIRNLVVPE